MMTDTQIITGRKSVLELFAEAGPEGSQRRASRALGQRLIVEGMRLAVSRTTSGNSSSPDEGSNRASAKTTGARTAIARIGHGRFVAAIAMGVAAAGSEGQHRLVVLDVAGIDDPVGAIVEHQEAAGGTNHQTRHDRRGG